MKKEDVGVVVWDFKGEKGNWHGDEKNPTFGKQMCAELHRDNEREMDSDLQAQQVSPHHTSPIFFASISDDSTVPGARPFSKFFTQLRDR